MFIHNIALANTPTKPSKFLQATVLASTKHFPSEQYAWTVESTVPDGNFNSKATVKSLFDWIRSRILQEIQNGQRFFFGQLQRNLKLPYQFK
jgi:hypothetical protein